MKTSFSSEGLRYGVTGSLNIGPGLTEYAAYKGYSFTYNGVPNMPDWASFTREINLGRPVMLGVDSSGNGVMDHSVTTIGYRDTNGYLEYACYNTSSRSIRWYQFRPVSSSYDYGIGGMLTLKPEDFTDTVRTTSSGNWGDASWDNGVPGVNSDAAINNGQNVHVLTSGNANTLTNSGNLHVKEQLTLGLFHNMVQGITEIDESAANLQVATDLRNYGTIVQNDGMVGVSGNYIVDRLDDHNVASVSQNGGSVIVQNQLIVDGYNYYDDRGQYGLHGGQLTAVNGIDIASYGRFEWTGGNLQSPSINVRGYFAIGFDVDLMDLENSSDLYGGTLEIEPNNGYLVITNNATATHTTGTTNLRNIKIGDTTRSGSIHLSGDAEMNGSKIWIESGSFVQNGGDLKASEKLIVRADKDNDIAKYEIHDGTAKIDQLDIGMSDYTVGIVQQYGGDVELGGLAIASGVEAEGTYELHGGTLTVDSTWIGYKYLVGSNLGTKALFKQTGGTLRLEDYKHIYLIVLCKFLKIFKSFIRLSFHGNSPMERKRHGTTICNPKT